MDQDDGNPEIIDILEKKQIAYEGINHLIGFKMKDFDQSSDWIQNERFHLELKQN